MFYFTCGRSFNELRITQKSQIEICDFRIFVAANEKWIRTNRTITASRMS